MTPKHFSEHNRTFKAPANWDEEKQGKCGDLQVWQNEEFIMSCWGFDRNEILWAILTRQVFIALFLPSQPVMWATSINPFTEIIDIEKSVNLLLERRIKQFLVAKLRASDDLKEIGIIQSDWLKNLLTEFAKSFAEIPQE